MSTDSHHQTLGRHHAAPYRYYDFIMAGFVTLLLLSNLIGAGKVATVDLPVFGEFSFGAAVLFFPLSYVIGDVLTEVYGYARARRVVWAGVGAMLFMSFMSWAVVSMPPADGWQGQAAYESVFGQTPRIVGASLFAFWAGELVNAYVMARMKVWTAGRHLWSRTIGSTFFGQGVDSLLFYPLAFWGVWPTDLLLMIMATNFALKVSWEAVLTPVTYRVVAVLKAREQEDYFDEDTDFTPFKIKT